jgi:hypothetical protein
MGYHQQAKCSQHGCWEISKRKQQGSCGKSTSQDDFRKNDHFFGQELLMDAKKYLFFKNIFLDIC